MGLPQSWSGFGVTYAMGLDSSRRLIPAEDNALAFDRLILELSEAFIGSSSNDPHLIDYWLARLAVLVGVERVTLWELTRYGEQILRCHTYVASGVPEPPPVMPSQQFNWLMEQNRRGRITAWARMPDDVPASARAEREYGLQIGSKSLLSIPIATQRSLCVLAFVSLKDYRLWSAAVVERLRLISSLIAVAAVRDRVEFSLRESEERFRGAFEHSSIGIALVTPAGRWIQVNAALCRMLGYQEAELLQGSFQRLTHSEDLAPNLALFERALRGEIDHYELHKRYVHKEGRIIPAYLTVSIVRDAERRPLYFVSQIQDLTDRTASQLEIARLRMDLTHSARLALTGRLTASLVHQLAQPVAAAQLNGETCQRLLSEGTPTAPELSKAVEDVVSSCQRAADVIQNVRALLRKEPGPRKTVSLNQLVTSIVEVTRHGLRARNIHLDTDLDPGLPDIDGNPVELQQVILNLVLNAAEALEPLPARRDVVVRTRATDGAIEMTVHDTGPGVNPSDLLRLFEPFYTTKLEGMGMGLPICSEIVRSHGGNIRAENDPAGGLTVLSVFQRA